MTSGSSPIRTSAATRLVPMASRSRQGSATSTATPATAATSQCVSPVVRVVSGTMGCTARSRTRTDAGSGIRGNSVIGSPMTGCFRGARATTALATASNAWLSYTPSALRATTPSGAISVALIARRTRPTSAYPARSTPTTEASAASRSRARA